MFFISKVKDDRWISIAIEMIKEKEVLTRNKKRKNEGKKIRKKEEEKKEKQKNDKKISK